jgi:hypothetical protein
MAHRQLPLTTIAYLSLVESGVGHIRALKQAADAVEPVALLAIARHTSGRWLSQAEYAQAAGISERTAQRQWAAFRKAFPQEQSPEHFARVMYAEYDRRLEDRSTLIVSPAPRELQPA